MLKVFFVIISHKVTICPLFSQQFTLVLNILAILQKFTNHTLTRSIKERKFPAPKRKNVKNMK